MGKTKPNGGRKGPAKGGQEARSAERRAKALDLRKAGLSYRAIAAHGREHGWAPRAYGEAQAYRDVRHELDRLAEQCADTAESVRELELARLDRLLLALDGRVRSGDPQAVNTAIRISESRRRLLGVDAPEKQEIEHKGGVVVHLPEQYETEEAWLKASGSDI